MLVVNDRCAVARGLQGEPPGGDAIGEVGVVLGEVFRVDVAGEQVEATADEYVLRETAYETAVFGGLSSLGLARFGGARPCVQVVASQEGRSR